VSRADEFPLWTADQLCGQPAQQYLIDTVLPAGSLVALYGASGSAKTFLALSQALSIAAGVPWLGRKVEPGWVVYIVGEGKAGLGKRVAAWQAAANCPSVARIRFLPEAVNLLDGRDVERAKRTISTALPEPPKLIVIDTLARAMVGGDENAVKDVSRVIAAADDLRGDGSALLLHHTGRNGEHERGSTALRGAVDVLAKTEREGRSPRVKYSCAKTKDSAEWSPVDLLLESSGDSCVLHSPSSPRSKRSGRSSLSKASSL
jgi:RecA-family ATPase